ncbi:sodium-dependent bicarbonate transport family permease [Thiomicrorhabdus sediminis]|uniref:Sodium-dependent bicarbonate transport family permease n=1 Tax=Thiomicrorhabdus sediminis TaxID=2580412 RepID=A0A4P9K7H6_9GAMM|nr:sodium-dependent bicarbonate transport family permease [Thiomicrorhabdus sediminis]QCU90888.1 sodium-dependent bicarbonate transport family permease [Thiomicrorhabdus sediminis]
MDFSLLNNLIDPAILFFFFGLLAASVRSNLEIPAPIAKFFSLYLLIAIGFKGGVALSTSGFTSTAMIGIGAALLMALLVPAYSFLILRNRTNPYNAAAIAATYGSISAVTFIAAQQYLTKNEVDFGGYMTVAMVLMESPAIIMAVLLATLVRKKETFNPAHSVGAAAVSQNKPISLKEVLHEAFTDGAHLLLIGSLVIGFITGPAGKEMMAPFTSEIFKGILAFFLLEMGLLVARQLRQSKDLDKTLVSFALIMPMVNAGVAVTLAYTLGMSQGDTLLLAVLAASGSYIVVPAICRYAIPEAKPGVYFSMSLAFTFPFNIVVGIPLYYTIIDVLWN